MSQNEQPKQQPPRRRRRRKSTDDGSIRTSADLLPERPASQRAPGRRRPAWEASKDSGMYPDEVLAAEPARESLLQTRGTAVVVVLEYEANAPRVLVTPASPTESKALYAWASRTWWVRELLETVDIIQASVAAAGNDDGPQPLREA